MARRQSWAAFCGRRVMDGGCSSTRAAGRLGASQGRALSGGGPALATLLLIGEGGRVNQAFRPWTDQLDRSRSSFP